MTAANNNFFNPFAELKNVVGTNEKKKSAEHKNADVKVKKSGGQNGAANKAKNNSVPVAATQQQNVQEAEDAALFLASVQSVDRYKKSYSSTGAEQSEPDMAQLLAEADKKKRKEAAQGGVGQAAPATAQAYKSNPAGHKTLKTQSAAVQAANMPAQALPDEDLNNFATAMQGVAPIDGKGRDLPLPVSPAVTRKPANLVDFEQEFAQGKFEFALEYTEEFFEGHVMGLDPLVIAKIRAGQYSYETHIDLHGLNAEQAYETLLDFIRRSYTQGKRMLIVVTGRGKNSPGGLSVLRQNMHDWLTKDPLKRVVLAFCTAQPKDGGAGAMYVMLRKFKKSNGKIRWDKSPWEENPLL